MIETIIKTCSTCKNEKPLEEYARHKVAKDGRQNECKQCSNARHRASYAANREVVNQKHAIYRKENQGRINKNARGKYQERAQIFDRLYGKKLAEQKKQTMGIKLVKRLENAIQVNKICAKCGFTKPVSQFYGHVGSKDGLRARCKACDRQFAIKYKDRVRDRELKRNYGITLDDYRAIFNSQKGVCAICQNPESIAGRTLAVDHDHKTDEIRGLLCSKCNSAIGILGDTSESLYKAYLYLTRKQTNKEEAAG